MPTCHIAVPRFHPWLCLLIHCRPWKVAGVAEGLGPLLTTWETRMEVMVPGFSPAPALVTLI